ncbi:unnamed protein product [Lupinus luteus]|uniref:Phosphoinositide phospholipase C n=1 Tax=Lupinus luteus TaxID=3873 RepID=A0AAV1X901_LUPLU
MSKQAYTVCFCFSRRFKVALAEAPPEIKTLFQNYSENELMKPSQLQRFLVEFQKQEKATIEDAQAIIDSLKHFHRKGLNNESFFKYLLSDNNQPLPPSLGLSSDCSDVPIIHALKRGVRVIELDIWPNASKDNVDVLHGRTLTTPVELITCLRAIKEHAFDTSEYPVVITLEDHLTPDLQAKVAEMVSQTFGDTLFYPTIESLKQFPSPESLKRRIIISTKPPKEYLEAKEIKEKGEGSQHGKASVDEEALGKEAPNIERGTIADVKPKGGLRESLKVDPDKVRRVSLSEGQLEKAVITLGKEVVRFTQGNIVRVYPKGTRITSSNYNPLLGWMHGAQMVALNMQGYGKPLWLMQGMFKANGGCGYVKKPDFLLKTGPSNEVFDPKARLSVKTTLKVGIAGVPDDTVMRKTKVVEDNWLPNWNEVFEFTLTVPELALLVIEVLEYDMSDKDDFGGQTVLPVWELRSGIRAFVPSKYGAKFADFKIYMKCNALTGSIKIEGRGEKLKDYCTCRHTYNMH